jgi:protein SCO1/2
VRTFLLPFFVCSQFAFAEGLPFFENKEMTPYWSAEGKEQLQPAQVTQFLALDQNGKAVSQASMKGRVTLVNFFFVKCPGICPAMMKSVQKIQKSLAQDIRAVQIYSFSVMPESDTPAKLKEYAKTYGIDAGSWTLLTGSKDEIYRVGKEMFKADGAVGAQKKKDSFIHTQNLYLVDQNLNIRGIYNTSDVGEMQNLKGDIKTLL